MPGLNMRSPVAGPEMAAVADAELLGQQSTPEMTASENTASSSVTKAQGSVVTKKSVEEHPGRRHAGGWEHVRVSEQLAIDRVKAPSRSEHANRQSHAGAVNVIER